MSDEVKELLAKIGENVVRGKTFCYDRSRDPATDQVIISFKDDPRRLVIDPDGAINWYNSELPNVIEV